MHSEPTQFPLQQDAFLTRTLLSVGIAMEIQYILGRTVLKLKCQHTSKSVLSALAGVH